MRKILIILFICSALDVNAQESTYKPSSEIGVNIVSYRSFPIPEYYLTYKLPLYVGTGIAYKLNLKAISIYTAINYYGNNAFGGENISFQGKEVLLGLSKYFLIRGKFYFNISVAPYYTFESFLNNSYNCFGFLSSIGISYVLSNHVRLSLEGGYYQNIGLKYREGYRTSEANAAGLPSCLMISYSFK
jgi:hypothetical protein